MLSTFFANKIIDHMLRNQAYTPPITVYASVHSGDPGLVGSNEIALSRVFISFTAASAKATSNANDLVYNGTPITEVKFIGLWDASSGGNFIGHGTLVPVDFTGAAGTDVISATGHGLVDGDKVAFFANPYQALPGGITQYQTYYVRDKTTNTLKIAATAGGAAIDLTADGDGQLFKVLSLGSGNRLEILTGTVTFTLS